MLNLFDPIALEFELISTEFELILTIFALILELNTFCVVCNEVTEAKLALLYWKFLIPMKERLARASSRNVFDEALVEIAAEFVEIAAEFVEIASEFALI